MILSQEQRSTERVTSQHSPTLVNRDPLKSEAHTGTLIKARKVTTKDLADLMQKNEPNEGGKAENKNVGESAKEAEVIVFSDNHSMDDY